MVEELPSSAGTRGLPSFIAADGQGVEKFATAKRIDVELRVLEVEKFPPSQEPRPRQVRTMSLNGLFAIRKPKGITSAAVLNLIQPLFRSSKNFQDHLVARDAPGHRSKRRKLAEKRVKVHHPKKGC
jgi:hypothetical protein